MASDPLHRAIRIPLTSNKECQLKQRSSAPLHRITTLLVALATVPALATPADAAENRTSMTKAISAAAWYAAVPPKRLANGNLRFSAIKTDAPKVRKICITAWYAGQPPIPAGPLHTKCFKVSKGTLGRYFDTNCPFHGAYYSEATFYNGSNKKLAHRKSKKVSFIC
ncbi:hypothetical protein [Nonomuraea sp. B5E05]|uniref:hypothetical protein n=1 Tax=Nonomuraea sp. B5E05 TaxID=3153569 RepID=UPI003261255E